MSLTADEREVILTWNDAERRWRIYSNSLTQRGAVLDLARRVGIQPKALGSSIEFALPVGRGISLSGVSPSKAASKMQPVAGSGSLPRGRSIPRQKPESAGGAQP